MPYAAPSLRAEIMYQTVGPGRRAQLEGHSTTTSPAGFSREEEAHPDTSMEWAGQSSSTTFSRSGGNRYAPLHPPPSPIHGSRSGAPTRFPRIDDSDVEYDYARVSGSDSDSMSLGSWDEDDAEFDMVIDPARPLSREPSASNRENFESYIPGSLFDASSYLPKPQEPIDTDRSTTPFSVGGSTSGAISYRDVVTRGPRGSSSSEHVSRAPVWDPEWGSTSGNPPMCIICEHKPAYRGKNGVCYPTCGLTCASKLDEEDKKARHSRTGSSWSSPWPGKCTVCKTRDVHISKRTGRRYPTCGLNCASALKPSATEAKSKCELCHNRDKAVSKVTGKPYEYCGRECRDKAKHLLEKAIAGTCRTCLVCWSALGPNVNLPTCGERCHLLTEALAPVMIEIPRGHALFDKYNRRFLDGWGNREEEKWTIQHTYYFVQNLGAKVRHTKYKGVVEAGSHGQRPDGQEYWVGLRRECSTGDSGEVNPCFSHTCTFCDVVRNGFQPIHAARGLTLSLRSGRANDNLRGPGAAVVSSGKVLMFVRLIRSAGRASPEVTMQQIAARGHEMRREHPVVKIVERKYGRQVETGDVYVFEPAAILPLGCVLYA